MMAALKRILWPEKVRAVTHHDVEPAVDYADERAFKAVQAKQVDALMSMERKSWEVREHLARNVLAIVSGQQ